MPEHSSRSNIFTPLSEIGLVLLAIGPTLALGGVHRSVQLAAALLSALCLLLVWLNRRPNGRGLILPWFGGALLVLCAATLFQLIPLPMGLLRALAPATVEVLEVSLAKAGGLPSTHPISLDPGSTLWEALKLACYSLAFIASHNFYYRGRRRHRLALSFTCLGIVMMFLALAGAVVAPGKPLMLYTPDAGRAAGLITTSFVNPNHSAGFLIICALMAMGLAIDTRDLQSKILLGLAAVMLGSGVMLTVSRGGILALALGMDQPWPGGDHLTQRLGPDHVAVGLARFRPVDFGVFVHRAGGARGAGQDSPVAFRPGHGAGQPMGRRWARGVHDHLSALYAGRHPPGHL